MSAELLREVASLIRARVEAVPPGPWEPLQEEFTASVNRVSEDDEDAGTEVVVGVDYGVAEYIASWHPSAALDVVDWLDVTAQDVGSSTLAFKAAEAFALSYLGRDS